MKRWSAYLGCTLVILLFVVGCHQTEEPISPMPTPQISPMPAPQVSPLVTPTQQTVKVASVWPEGKILYHADQSGVYQLYVAQGQQTPTLLTPDSPSAVEGNWSPDGQRIAFAATNGPDNIQIYTMQADGSDLTLLPVDQPSLNWYPKWSPDGEMLLFVTNRDGNFEIYKATVDGDFLVNLTNHSYNDQEPDWSPDGQKIIFVSDREGGDGLYLMDAEGSNVQQLLDDSWGCRYPRWSPDGQQIAFMGRV
ncbi:MAG: TolB family protein, partial [Anaerolineae bacterium]